jgi:hypothetical protein
MKALFARLLLAGLFAAQVAMLGVTQAGARQMVCCVEAADHPTAAGHAHCPPVGASGNSCCPDCPYLLTAMLLAESAVSPHIHRPQIAVFPSIALRADSRVEEPPVPPPRNG